MQYIGCHLSSSKGFAAMGKTALSIGANTFQYFSRNPRGGNARAFDVSDAQALVDAGLLKKTLDGVKVLGRGELTKKLTVNCAAFSASAKEKIEKAGGKAEVK